MSRNEVEKCLKNYGIDSMYGADKMPMAKLCSIYAELTKGITIAGNSKDHIQYTMLSDCADAVEDVILTKTMDEAGYTLHDDGYYEQTVIKFRMPSKS